MSLLYDGIFSSVSFNGRGDFQFNIISYAHKVLLKSITKRQRARFKKHGTIPPQLLQVLWGLGWIPGDKAPVHGMRVKALLKLLEEGPFESERQRRDCLWLYEKIVQEELMSKPKWLPSHQERYLGEGQKRIPLSEIRKWPGTVA